MNKEMCWNITSKCNQDCVYCFRALGLPECSLGDNIKMLDYVHANGVNEITWSGGEPLMYPHLSELLKKSTEYEIKNKLNTNASLILPDNLGKISDYVDNFTFSLDSLNSVTNGKLGRGINHQKKVDEAVSYLTKYHPNKDITINVVVSRLNLHDIKALVNYLNSIKITGVRVFQVSPIRGLSIETYDQTKITKEIFDDIKEYCRINLLVKDLTFRSQEDLENKYIVISPDGKLCYNQNGKDILIKNLKESTR